MLVGEMGFGAMVGEMSLPFFSNGKTTSIFGFGMGGVGGGGVRPAVFWNGLDLAFVRFTADLTALGTDAFFLGVRLGVAVFGRAAFFVRTIKSGVKSNANSLCPRIKKPA